MRATTSSSICLAVDPRKPSGPAAGKADHLAQQIGVGALLQKRAKSIISSVIVGSSVRVQGLATKPYEDPR